jgi:hypothetical protein
MPERERATKPSALIPSSGVPARYFTRAIHSAAALTPRCAMRSLGVPGRGHEKPLLGSCRGHVKERPVRIDHAPPNCRVRGGVKRLSRRDDAIVQIHNCDRRKLQSFGPMHRSQAQPGLRAVIRLPWLQYDCIATFRSQSDCRLLYKVVGRRP